MVSPNKGQPCAHLRLVLNVLLPKEIEQRNLFDVDTIPEEQPSDNGIENRADWIHQDNLQEK